MSLIRSTLKSERRLVHQGEQQEIWILEENSQLQHHCYRYGRDGRVEESWKRADSGLVPINYQEYRSKILEIRKRCQLQKMNEQVLRQKGI